MRGGFILVFAQDPKMTGRTLAASIYVRLVAPPTPCAPWFLSSAARDGTPLAALSSPHRPWAHETEKTTAARETTRLWFSLVQGHRLVVIWGQISFTQQYYLRSLPILFRCPSYQQLCVSLLVMPVCIVVGFFCTKLVHHHPANDWGIIRTKKKRDGTIILVATAASCFITLQISDGMIVGLRKFVPFPSTDYNIRSVWHPFPKTGYNNNPVLDSQWVLNKHPPLHLNPNLSLSEDMIIAFLSGSMHDVRLT